MLCLDIGAFEIWQLHPQGTSLRQQLLFQSLRDPEEWAKMIWDHIPDLIMLYSTVCEKLGCIKFGILENASFKKKKWNTVTLSYKFPIEL